MQGHEEQAVSGAQSRASIWIYAAIAAVLVAVAVISGAYLLLRPRPATTTQPSGQTMTVHGALELQDGYSGRQTGAECRGTGGYSDINGSTSVTITDATGTVIALGRLDAGHVAMDASNVLKVCEFQFGVPGVPVGKGFYGVEVSHRGRVQFTEAQTGDAVHLTLGS